MNLTENVSIASVGHRLNTSKEAFGELRDSSPVVGNSEELRARMQEDGYLFVRGFFKREEVMSARSVIVERLAAEGLLQPGTDPMEGIIRKGGTISFRPDLTETNPPLERLLYSGRMMEFYREFFGEPIRH
jgi:hypothetical protein